MCTHLSGCLCLCKRENSLRAWVKEREVFSSAIICRFLYSLFPLCLAHIRRTNSTPLAILGVLKSRPHSQGKAVRAHGGRAADRHTAYHNALYKHNPNPLPHFIPLVFFYFLAMWGSVSHNDWSPVFVRPDLWDPRYEYREDGQKYRWWEQQPKVSKVHTCFHLVSHFLFTEGCVPVKWIQDTKHTLSRHVTLLVHLCLFKYNGSSVVSVCLEHFK